MRQPDPTEEHRRLRSVWIGISAAVIVIVLFVTLLIVKPAMPDRIVLLTGPEGSTYHHLGGRYAEDLRRRGLEADVVVTRGALDNLRRLAEGGQAVAFAPSALTEESDAGVDISDLVALGSVGIEPLWLFYRSDLDIARIPDLAGRTVATGGAGTVSDHVARKLLAANGIADAVELRPLSGPAAQALAEGFAAGTIDAGFAAAAANSSGVQAILGAEDVSFLSFDRAEAYAGLISGVTALTVPEGILDLARDVPPQDAHLLSATTCLVAHEGVHAAVVPMLLVAAENVRPKTTMFSTTLEFPSRDQVTLPLDPAARRYFDQGETGLSRFLPYKVTRFLNHLGFLVLPLLTAAAVLLKAAPVGLRIWGGLRLTGLLKRLEAVEKGHAAGVDRSKLLADLDRLDHASARMLVPRAVVHDYIDFRQFLHDMRERVERGTGDGG